MTDSQAAQGPTATYCPDSEFNPEDPTYRPHNMVTKMGPGKMVRSVDFCMGCDWIDFAALDRYAEAAIKESMTERAQRIAVASETEPFAFVQRSDEVLSMSEIAAQALAAATLMERNDTFSDKRAQQIHRALMDEIWMLGRQERKQAIRDVWSAMLDLIGMIKNSGSATPLSDLRGLVRERISDNN